jgi:hypothetical protein
VTVFALIQARGTRQQAGDEQIEEEKSNSVKDKKEPRDHVNGRERVHLTRSVPAVPSVPYFPGLEEKS